MSQTALIITKNAKTDIRKRKLLILSIRKKRKELMQLILKLEMLRINLQLAENEYMVKVGSLFIKDNHLDLEIIRLRNILKLMSEGLSQDEAIEQISETYYSQQIELENEQIKVEREQKIYEKRDQKKTKPSENIKKLWKKLISRFHPDLVQDNKEKIKRDKIMKQINRAYQESDYDKLVMIDRENLPQKERTIENLEEILISISNEITQQTQNIKSLKLSEWYGWMGKINIAKKKNINIFANTEKQLLNDIAAKMDILIKLKDQIQKEVL